MSRTDEPLALVTLADRKLSLRPGGKLRVGRRAENDFHIEEKIVSRFHAELAWDRGEPRPHVKDLNSQNGVLVDGERVLREEPLRNGTRLEIGASCLVVQLYNCDETPALLEDQPGDSQLAFPLDLRPSLAGRLLGPEGGRNLLLSLESERRTGTLKLTFESRTEALTFCQGRIYAPQGQDAHVLKTLRRVAGAAMGSFYSFGRQFRLPDGQGAWLSPSDLLRVARAG